MNSRMHDREEIARRYGFESFAQLLDVSEKLSLSAPDVVQTYIARRSDGTWFVWEDARRSELPEPHDE